MLSELLSFTYPHSHTCSLIFLYHFLSSNPYCFPFRLFQRDQAFSVNKSIGNTTTDFFKQSAVYFIVWRSARRKIILKKQDQKPKSSLISSSVQVKYHISKSPHGHTYLQNLISTIPKSSYHINRLRSGGTKLLFFCFMYFRHFMSFILFW